MTEKYCVFAMNPQGFNISKTFIGEFYTKEEAETYAKDKVARGEIHDYYILPSSKCTI